MLAGFILLITAHSHALPVTETIYPTKAECETIRIGRINREILAGAIEIASKENPIEVECRAGKL